MKILYTVVTMLFTAAAHAAVPQTIDYQAYLTDAIGAPQNGSVMVTVSLYEQAVGGAALWSDTLSVNADNGLIGIALGRPGNPFPADLFETPKWLGITVAPDAEMIPRRQLTAVAYSLKSDDADSVQGLQASEIINAAAGAQYRFAGFSSATFDGNDGYLAMHQACQADFGADARMATTTEVLDNPIAGGAGGWVRPTQVVIDGDTVTEVPSMAGGNVGFGALDASSIINCNRWSSAGGVNEPRGLAVMPNYQIQATFCSTNIAVACSAP